jgi:hypothetical protein
MADLQLINNLGYNPSYPYGSSGSGVPTQTGASMGGAVLGSILGNLLIPGLGGWLGSKLGSMGAGALTRDAQWQGQQLEQPTAPAQSAGNNKGGDTGQLSQPAAPAVAAAQPAGNNKGGGSTGNYSGSGQPGGFNIPGGINWSPGSPGGVIPNSWQMLIYSRTPQFRQYLDQNLGMTPNQWLTQLHQGGAGVSGTAAAGGYTGGRPMKSAD